MINVIPTSTKCTNTQQSTNQNELEELQWWNFQETTSQLQLYTLKKH